MGRIVRLTENDLTKLVRRVIQEQSKNYIGELLSSLKKNGWYTISEYKRMNDKSVIDGDRDFLFYDKASTTIGSGNEPFYYIRPKNPKGVSNFSHEFETLYVDNKSTSDNIIVCFDRRCYSMSKNPQDYSKVMEYITTPYIH
jgi:hypothetical protein